MSINNKLPLIQMKNINQKYLSKRKEAIKIIRATSAKLNFNSKTFFNSIYYMDIVASKDQSLQKLSDYSDIPYEIQNIFSNILKYNSASDAQIRTVENTYRRHFKG